MMTHTWGLVVATLLLNFMSIDGTASDRTTCERQVDKQTDNKSIVLWFCFKQKKNGRFGSIALKR